MDNEEYRKKIETRILEIMKEKLEKHQLDAPRAKQIAKYVLDSLHPHMTLNQIHDVVQNFDDHFSELVPIVQEVSREYDEKVNKAVADHTALLLKKGMFNEADILLKKAKNKEVKLSD